MPKFRNRFKLPRRKIKLKFENALSYFLFVPSFNPNTIDSNYPRKKGLNSEGQPHDTQEPRVGNRGNTSAIHYTSQLTLINRHYGVGGEQEGKREEFHGRLTRA